MSAQHLVDILPVLYSKLTLVDILPTAIVFSIWVARAHEQLSVLHAVEGRRVLVQAACYEHNFMQCNHELECTDESQKQGW